MKAVILLAIVAAAAAMECQDVTSAKQSTYCGGPAKACAPDGGSTDDFSSYNQAGYDAVVADWAANGMAACDAYKAMTDAEKEAFATQACANACDTALAAECKIGILPLIEQGMCTDPSPYYCDIKLKTTVGGELCADATDCGLLPCYSSVCYSWCHSTASCDAMVTAGTLAAKDATKCIGSSQERGYECVDVEKKSPYCEGPQKVCVLEGDSPKDYSGYTEEEYNTVKKAWTDEGKALCDKYKKLSSDDKKTVLTAACEEACDADKKDACVKELAPLLEKEFCTDPSTEYCDITKRTTEGGDECKDEADCGLLPCYKDACMSWCYAESTCTAAVEEGLIAGKDVKPCISSAALPAAVPTLAVLLLVLLAL